ncbi:hypothetical protein SARC_05625 [Sphaeroforma arctica JP610]|uniref:Uncharacterized protein n=1 Tax=Sphaeroforma arctica JP610 TaxID=667725 RepID=A0A0L0FZQ3_9EUKA|nr:hypothetical protein SARC_05625 [Sphaeroforma arctica JP610]KNC82074.1 hypothetical protein SARC_05625 [Sphaeroforma arctica JP610]|eukprot:XP_014155976.1 hypothetical protein SARC_05625 [Sphaeroforma arctica JP610]
MISSKISSASDINALIPIFGAAEEAQWEGNYPPLRKQSETDSDSSNSELQYQHAYTVIQKARDLDAGSVPDDLFESISSLVEEAEAESDDEE